MKKRRTLVEQASKATGKSVASIFMGAYRNDKHMYLDMIHFEITLYMNGGKAPRVVVLYAKGLLSEHEKARSMKK